MNLLVDSTMKVSLLVLLGLGASALLKRGSAALRHWVLTVTIACSAVLPLLAVVVPTWHVHLGNPAQVRPIAPAAGTLAVDVGKSDLSVAASQSAFEPRQVALSSGQILGAAWIAGMVISLGMLLLGFARLTSIASQCEPLVQGKWVEAATDISCAYRLRRPVVLLTTDHPALLVTWGSSRPKEMLPTVAREWPEDRIRVVLSHELAHVWRSDWLVQMVGEVLRAVYWFNPLLWIACRRLRHHSEQACDDAVLSLGIDGADYATHLVDVARLFSERRQTWNPAPSIARPSSLEGRIRAMLNAGLNRRPITQSARLAIVSVLVVMTTAVAGLETSAQTASAGLSGFIVDATGTPISAVTVTLVDSGPPILEAGKPVNIRSKAAVKNVLRFIAEPMGLRIAYDAGVPNPVITVALDGVTVQQALDDVIATSQLSYRVLGERSIFVMSDPKNVKHEVRTDTAGYFQFVGLTAGEYILHVQQMGFASRLDPVKLSEGEALQRTIALDVGTLVETIRVTDRNDPGKPTVSTRPPPSPKPCTTSGGGQIVPPTKIRDVRPQSPLLAGSPVEGRVVLQVRIGTDGFVKDVRPTLPVDLTLATAAIAAVSQWQFTPTLLNCVPVEVNMTATVTFASEH